MAAKSKVADVAVAIAVAVLVGVGLGLGIGFAARSLGWSTNFVGPFTGAVVGGLVVAIFQLRSRRAGGGGA